MRSSGGQAADFIKVLRPTLDAANLTSVLITCCDAEGWSSQSSMLNELKSRGVESMLGVITGHAYTSQPTSSMNTKLPVWQTEAADLNGAWTTAWYSGGGAGEGWTWANNIMTAITSGNAAAYLYWIGVQGGDTNSKMVRIANNAVTPSKRLWAMANFSRFIRPGAVRVGVSGAPSGIKTTGFRNVDGRVSVQILNSGSERQVTIAITGGAGGFVAQNATGWVTDNTRDCNEIKVAIDAGKVTGSVPSRSMVTFVLTPAPDAAAALS
jgi:O-glycosyl hydrolase